MILRSYLWIRKQGTNSFQLPTGWGSNTNIHQMFLNFFKDYESIKIAITGYVCFCYRAKNMKKLMRKVVTSFCFF